MGGVAAPQPGRDVDAAEAVHRGEAVALAVARVAALAGRALAARQEHLDRDAIADGDAPPLARRGSPTSSMTPTVSWPGMNA